MIQSKTALKGALAACLLAFLASAQSRITCSSDNGGRQYCDADTRNGVVLVRQLSQSRCTQGRTWGFDRRGIWVDRGCRAEFAVGRDSGYGPGGGRPGDRRPDDRGPGDRRPDDDRPGYNRPGQNVQVISCSSDNGKRQWCRQDDGNARVRLIKQRSESRCQQGYSWGTAPGSIWVDHGCRADFEVRSGR